MWKADLRWMKSDYAYFDDAVPKLKPNAPKWVFDSYNHYLEQLEEIYGKKNDEALKKIEIKDYK